MVIFVSAVPVFVVQIKKAVFVEVNNYIFIMKTYMYNDAMNLPHNFSTFSETILEWCLSAQYAACISVLGISVKSNVKMTSQKDMKYLYAW